MGHILQFEFGAHVIISDAEELQDHEAADRACATGDKATLTARLLKGCDSHVSVCYRKEVEGLLSVLDYYPQARFSTGSHLIHLKRT